MSMTSGLVIPHNASKQTVIDERLAYPTFKSTSAVEQTIKEFTFGMHLLQHYIARTNIEIETIAADNLRLLHSNLKRQSNYKRLLTHSKSNRAKTLDWYWTPLVSNHELTVGLLCMNKDNAIYPNHFYGEINHDKTNCSPANIFSHSLHSAFSNHEKNDGSYRLLLAVSGGLVIKSVEETYHDNQNRGAAAMMKAKPDRKILMAELKKGDAFIEKNTEKNIENNCAGQHHTYINSLHTSKDPCIVLCAYLSSPEKLNPR
ncbi:MAG: hypothetical protein GXP08_13900 [Gammaproteobacteria bacterium]|nr:hypothetical protein [Gammaproteobacteria bacterium]